MRARLIDSISEIDPGQWNALTSPDFPFADHAYLDALESSGSVSEESGWKPRHVTLWHGEKLVGALPLYRKTNSYGEYIFDWEWARAYYQHRVAYYPKLTCAIPFTPATGPKLLLHPASDRAALLEAVRDAVRGEDASSAHFLFLTEEESRSFDAPWLVRHSFQYHWHNRGYRDFADFLDALKARKAKQIRREREQLTAQGLSIRLLSGAELTPDLADTMHDLYLATIAKMGAIAYLNRDFYRRVFAAMADSIHLAVASRDDQVLAAAIFYRKGDSLFGRYWGCREEIRNLHFELCYYQGIDLAIRLGLRRFEAGAQGEHKIARGFLPQLTYSAHYLEHPAFHEAIACFVEEERRAIARFFQELEGHSPYREQGRLASS